VKYLLDTCTLSHFARRQPYALARFQASDPSTLGVSAVTVHEVEYGLRANPAAERAVGPAMRGFLDVVRSLAFDGASATRAAMVRAQLRAAGTPVGAYDLLIAATALEHDLVLVTSNTREFARIPDLALEDWCLPD